MLRGGKREKQDTTNTSFFQSRIEQPVAHNNVYAQKGCVLSFKKGMPVARIEGGAYAGKIIHIYDKDKKEDKKKILKDQPGNVNVPRIADPLAELDISAISSGSDETKEGLALDDVATLFKTFVDKYEDREDAMDKITVLMDYLKCNKKPTEEDLVSLFNNNRAILDGERGKYMNLKEGSFIPIPDKNNRSCIYIAGQSGCGKSYWGARYAEEYHRLFPERPIYLISRKDEDPEFDDLVDIVEDGFDDTVKEIKYIKRIVINDEMVFEPISYKELANSLCIFDDIDTIPEKRYKNAVHALVNDLLEVGRASNISVIRMCHQPNKGIETKTILTESHMIVLFPRATIRNQLDYLCQTYLGFDKKMIQDLVDLPARAVVIMKNYPMTIMHEKGIHMIN